MITGEQQVWRLLPKVNEQPVDNDGAAECSNGLWSLVQCSKILVLVIHDSSQPRGILRMETNGSV
jgi:hypothetical protein